MHAGMKQEIQKKKKFLDRLLIKRVLDDPIMGKNMMTSCQFVKRFLIKGMKNNSLMIDSEYIQHISNIYWG